MVERVSHVLSLCLLFLVCLSRPCLFPAILPHVFPSRSLSRYLSLPFLSLTLSLISHPISLLYLSFLSLSSISLPYVSPLRETEGEMKERDRRRGEGKRQRRETEGEMKERDRRRGEEKRQRRETEKRRGRKTENRRGRETSTSYISYTSYASYTSYTLLYFPMPPIPPIPTIPTQPYQYFYSHP